MNDFTSKTLARELIEQSEQYAAATPMDGARRRTGGQFTGDQCFVFSPVSGRSSV
jgi:hypothetical protein